MRARKYSLAHKVMLCAALLAVLGSAVLPITGSQFAVRGAHAAPPAQAETFAAACANPVATVTCYAAAALIIWYGYSAATGAATPDEVIEELYQQTLAWWEGAGDGTPEREQIISQWTLHPAYLDPNADVMAAFAGIVLDLNAAGWTLPTWGGNTVTVLPMWAPGTYADGVGVAALEWSGTLDANPSQVCHPGGGMINQVSVARGATGGASASTSLRVDVYDGVTDALMGTGSSLLYNTGSFTSDTILSNQGWGGGFSPCDLVETPIRIVVTVFGVHSSAWGGGGIADLRVQYQDCTSGVSCGAVETATVDAHAFIAGEAAIGLTAPSDERVWMPATAGAISTVEGWDTEAVPLANGGTGTLVEGGGNTGAAEDDTSWWEGLFGGVTGWLKKIWERLQDIEGTLSDVIAAVTALPTTIANLFNPAIAWADFVNTQYPASRDEFMAVAPGCYYAALDGATLFTGSGEDLTFTIGSTGGAEIPVTIPYQPGIAAVSQPLFAVLCAAVLFLWGLKKIANPIPDNQQLSFDI